MACTDTLSIKLPLSYSSRPSRVRLPEPPKALKLRYVSWKCTHSDGAHGDRDLRGQVGTDSSNLESESVLTIGTQFSYLYTAVRTH